MRHAPRHRSTPRHASPVPHPARSSDTWLRLILEQVPAIVWTTDGDLFVTSINGAGLERVGLEPDEVVGLWMGELLGDPEHPALFAHLRTLEEREAASYETEWAGRSYEVHIEPLRDRIGRPCGIIGVALDITKRRWAEEELAEKSAYFTQLFEDAPEGIVLLDEEDRVLRVNREFTRMFGYTAEEAVGRKINDLVVPEGRAREASSLSRRIADGESVNVEAVRQRKDGSTIDVSILGTPIELEDSFHIYGIYRDITERKKLESRLLRSQKMEAVGQLAAGVAHDFNNLLTAILGHAQMLASAADEDLAEDARQIERAAKRAAKLTHQLLTFGRKHAGEPRPLHLAGVIGEMDALLERLVGEDVELELALSPDLPPIEGDPAQLERVILNLAVNARDAMPSGGRLEIAARAVGPDRLEESPPGSNRWVTLSVRDTGEGMTEEERARMFEPFYTTKGHGKGTGLGLATVYGVVEGMNGHIAVDTSPGEGTTIRLYFPVADGPTEGAARSLKVADAPESGHETILLVEDEPSVRRMARRVLEDQGYRVLPAGDGEEALALAAEREGGRIDFLLSDVVMPRMSGYELGARLRASHPHLRAIFMSGYTETPTVPGEFGEGEAEFLHKPFSPHTLVRKVREVLSR
ncbi:MAG: PAS domain S-box protein [Gemmatimonadota bacterium]|nr:PAS domain S-box protein [Gemmatimonadota bacterium]